MTTTKLLQSSLSQVLKAFGATLFISILPNLILLFLRVDPPYYGSINARWTLLSFAAGGLLGDVFLHSLPHLLVESDHEHHDHHEDHHSEHNSEHHENSHNRALFIGLMVLLGYLIFYIAERVAGLHIGGHSTHQHSHSENEVETATSSKRSTRSSLKNGAVVAENRVKKHDSLYEAMMKHMAATGWLNLVADSMHNFTDGIAIGAAFSTGGSLALAKFISVLFHEVPHEIGDFTILVHSGLSKWQAIQAQFVTAVAAFVGTGVGLAFSSINKTTQDILLATTSGGFLYISTSIITSIANDQQSKRGLGYQQIALEMLGFLLGVGMMVVVTFLEE